MDLLLELIQKIKVNRRSPYVTEILLWEPRMAI